MPLEGSTILIESQSMHFFFFPSLLIKGYADVDLTNKKNLLDEIRRNNSTHHQVAKKL